MSEQRRRLYVHIGLHKTGTTSIQQCMTQANYQLHSSGVLYPSSARHPLAVTQHGLLAKAFDPTTPFQGAFALTAPVEPGIVVPALKHEIDLSGLATTVVSSEELSRLSGDQIATFARAFADFDIYPVAFVRNFPDLFEALYATNILYTSSTSQPSEHLMRTDIVSSFRSWASIAAEAKIHLVDFDDSPTKDSVADFLAVIGIDPALLPAHARTARLNRSIPPARVVVMRELRARKVPEPEIAALLVQLATVTTEDRQTCLPPDLRARLARSYDEQIAILRHAEFVRGLPATAATETAGQSTELTYIGDLDDALRALGRPGPGVPD